MRILVVANQCPWKSWDAKLKELADWFSPRKTVTFTLKHTELEDIPWVPYTSVDPNQNGDGWLGIDPAWYDQYVTPLGYGYDAILFVVDRKDWKSVRARGWRSDFDQGPVQLHIGTTEKERMTWPHFPSMPAFFQLARHEILHAMFMLTGQYDLTHYYWDRGEIDKARDMLIFPKDYQLPGLVRTLNVLKGLLDALKASQSTVPPIEEPIILNDIPTTPTATQKLYDVAFSCMGKHMGLDTSVPKALNCANALSHVLIKAGVTGLPAKGLAGTAALYEWLSKSKSFIAVDNPEAGDVVCYPTGYGTPKIKNGHIFIKGKYQMMSNNSKTGLWDNHWRDLQEADDYYTKKGGIPRYSFRWKG